MTFKDCQPLPETDWLFNNRIVVSDHVTGAERLSEVEDDAVSE